MENDITSSSVVGAYCTLRSADGSKFSSKCKKPQRLHFGSLRVRDNRIGSTTHPYHELSNNGEKFNNPIKSTESLELENDSIHLMKQQAAMTSQNDTAADDNGDKQTIESYSNDKVDRRNTLASCRPSTSSVAASTGANVLPSRPSSAANGSSLLMEFKRLGSYCTLRNEQKRKYLLRTISNLRNTRNDATLEQPFALGSYERIEDCLLELDTYLEEIDQYGGFEQVANDDNDGINGVAGIGGAVSSTETLLNQRTIEENEEKEILKTIDALMANDDNVSKNVVETYHEEIVDESGGASSNELELHNCLEENSNFVEEVELHGDIRRNLNRGHPYRNTINFPGDIAVVTNSASTPTTRGATINRSGKWWRRASMRKTRPIELPSQQISFPSHHSLQQENDITPVDTLPLIVSMLNASETVVPIVHYETANALPSHSRTDSNAICNTSSLGDEFLNMMLTQQPSSPVSLSRSQSYMGEADDTGATATGRAPRQMGRRAEARARVLSISSSQTTNGNQVMNNDRPSADNDLVMVATIQQQQQQQPIQHPLLQPQSIHQYHISSEPSSVNSTRNTSPVSLVSSSMYSASSASSTADENRSRNSTTNIRPTPSPPQNNSDPDSNDDQDDPEKSNRWPHGFSRILTGTCCTLGLFNLSRFSIFSIYFGANFIVQFLILSFIFGVPMLWLQICLGSNLRRSAVAMWQISPICKGVGIALLAIQSIVAIYSAVSVAWLLVYFRDSFVSTDARYRWEEPLDMYRGVGGGDHHVMTTNDSFRLRETVADYFNGVVLQRYQLMPSILEYIGATGGNPASTLGTVHFQLAFNLAVVWLIVFGVLSQGLRSHGKAVFVTMVLPLIGLFALCTKMLTMVNSSSLQNLFPSTDWQDFFLNTQSWISAGQEVFLTWALLGVSVMSIFSKSTSQHERKEVLRTDAIMVCLLTIVGLILAALLGNACVQILNENGFFYDPGSFENINSYVFLFPSNSPQLATNPTKWLPRYSSILGEGYRRPGMNPLQESGYQAIRLATELFPATLAAATQARISPVWCILGYFLFLFFAIGQLCAMWKPIAEALGNSMSAVLLSCVTGLLLAMPLVTESGISIIHFFDVILGGSWCVLLLWVAHIFCVFLVRGRPYTGDVLVKNLKLSQTLAAFVALAWNVVLPFGLMALCVLEYKSSGARDLYQWRSGRSYWSVWVRKCGGFMQMACLLVAPITAVIQIYRYLSNGPPDILDRIQLLYRPVLVANGGDHQQRHNNHGLYAESRSDRARPMQSIPAVISMDSNGASGGGGGSSVHDDAPPKYTPPPSYTTATGARIAKILRNSIRRSVRRIIGEDRRTGLNGANSPLETNSNNDEHHQQQQLPPAYCAVQIGQDYSTTVTSSLPPTIQPISLSPITVGSDMAGPRVLYNSQTHRIRTLKLHRRATAIVADSNESGPPTSSAFSSGADTLPRISSSTTSRRGSVLPPPPPPPSIQLTSHDVAQILRPSNLEQYHQLDNATSRLNRSMSVRPSARTNFNEPPSVDESTMTSLSSDYHYHN